MNNYTKLFQILNDPDLSKNKSGTERQALVGVLKEFSENLACHPEKTAEIAYNIAGLMATDYVRKLSADDPIDEILTIAGELELMPENSDELSEELQHKVNEL